MNNPIVCPLCNGHDVSLFYKRESVFYSCGCCRGIFRPKEDYLTPDAEKSRYEEHHNNVFDARYREFVSPVTSAVLQDFDPDHRGLDFGSGTGPVISKVLEGKGYDISQYDPFFADDKAVLQKRYNYIVCCEVMEHFYEPYKEFELLRSLLLPGGKLYCMTSLYNSQLDFRGWRYKDDPTHVFIYGEETLEWIRKTFGFSGLIVNERLAVFKKQESRVTK